MTKTVLETNTGGKGQKSFGLSKGPNKGGQDITINITSGGKDDVFIVQKLSTDNLDKTVRVGNTDQQVVWFNNFAIKKKNPSNPDGDPINQSYSVTIPGLSSWKASGRNIVIQDGNANSGRAYIFTGNVTNDTIELTDGDPGVGGSPPMA